MKREYGIARCGLACCLCTENHACPGCDRDGCPGASWCENRRCSMEKGLPGCYACPEEDCAKGMLRKSKPLGFTRFVRRYGMEELMDCLEKNEASGVIYHRQGVMGDYDEFSDGDELIRFIQTGKR